MELLDYRMVFGEMSPHCDFAFAVILSQIRRCHGCSRADTSANDIVSIQLPSFKAAFCSGVPGMLRNHSPPMSCKANLVGSCSFWSFKLTVVALVRNYLNEAP